MSRRKIVRQLRHGQMTIPKEFRDELGLQPDDLLQVELMNGRLEVTAVKAAPRHGSAWFKDLYDDFAPVRESMHGASEPEINDAIDQALREVREVKRHSR
jgi:AbrB family looped-hinge helix DNA binding protein